MTDTVDRHDKPGPLHGYEWRELPDKVIGVNFFKLKNCKVCRRLISKYSRNDMLRGSQRKQYRFVKWEQLSFVIKAFA